MYLVRHDASIWAHLDNCQANLASLAFFLLLGPSTIIILWGFAVKSIPKACSEHRSSPGTIPVREGWLRPRRSERRVPPQARVTHVWVTPRQNFDPKQPFGLRGTKLITDKLKLPYRLPIETGREEVGGRPEVDYLS